MAHRSLIKTVVELSLRVIILIHEPCNFIKSVYSMITNGKIAKSKKLQEYFKNSANVDDFGFANIKNGPAAVIDMTKALINTLTKIASETYESIAAINAFGNRNVQTEIAKSAEKMLTILSLGIKQGMQDITMGVQTASENYQKVGVAAQQAAALKTEN